MSAGKLPGKWERAIAGLLTEPTHAKAAAKAGVSEATLQRWLLLPEFQAGYKIVRRRIVEAAIRRLHGATGEAVTTLVKNLKCKNPQVQVRSALAILEHSFKATELIDLAGRVEELERRLEEQGDEASTTNRGPRRAG